MQLDLFPSDCSRPVRPFRSQLLKWVGNKQRFAQEIVSFFPERFGRYFEPFLGSGGVLATLAPAHGIAGDTFQPLIEIWQALRCDPDKLKLWYSDRWSMFAAGERQRQYERIKANYNADPNGADLLFLCRSCYGGVVRFRKADGYMSTPCGPHDPISPESFGKRVDEWHRRTRGTQFLHASFEETMRGAKAGDIVYCDPPYAHSQSILYGAQDFRFDRLLSEIETCKRRGVHVALSIDGTKKSGDVRCALDIPPGLFEREVFVNCGRSMLRRFQLNGHTLESELVTDRLLLTY